MNKAELIKALAELLTEKMEIGEEPTNGEVIKAVFPTAEIIETTYNGFHVVEVWFGGFLVRFRREWWNSPYVTNVN